MFKIYTDGSCRLDINKHKIGQFAYLLIDSDSNYIKPYISNIFYDVTNSDMEIQGLSFAIGEAADLTPFTNKIEIYTDSNYAYKGYNEWLNSWAKNNWLTSKKELVAQSQYWQIIYQCKINDTRNKINVKWVKGHNNNPYNNLVDAMCNGTIPKEDVDNVDNFKKIWYNKYIKR